MPPSFEFASAESESQSRLRGWVHRVTRAISQSRVAHMVRRPILKYSSYFFALVNAGLYAASIYTTNSLLFFGIASILSTTGYLISGSLGGLVDSSDLYSKTEAICDEHPVLVAQTLPAKMWILSESLQLFGVFVMLGLIPLQVWQLVLNQASHIVGILTTMVGATTISSIGRSIEMNVLSEAHDRLLASLKKLDETDRQALQVKIEEFQTQCQTLKEQLKSLSSFLQQINPRLVDVGNQLKPHHFMALETHSNTHTLLKNNKMEMQTFIELTPLGIDNLNGISPERLSSAIELCGIEVFNTDEGRPLVAKINNDLDWESMCISGRMSKDLASTPSRSFPPLSPLCLSKSHLFSAEVCQSSQPQSEELIRRLNM